MIDNIEELRANLEGCGFRYSGSLHQTDVKIVDSGAVEELPVGVAEGSHGPRVECVAVEEEVITVCICFTRVLEMNLADQIGHVGVPTAKQRDIIAVLADRNRQAAGEPCYSGKVPALREAFRRTFEGAVEGKGPAVAEYEIVSDVERGE